MSKKIKIILIALIAVVFVAFYTLGYELPYAANPVFIEPMLTPVVIWLMIIMLVAALVAVVLSIVTGAKCQSHETKVNNINTRWIGWGVAVPVALVMLLTFLFGSTDAIDLNGRAYNETIWLRASSMFVLTAVILIATAVVLILLSTFKRR